MATARKKPKAARPLTEGIVPSLKGDPSAVVRLQEAFRLFGFEFDSNSTKNRQKLAAKLQSFAVPQNNDGAITINAGGVYGTYVDIEGQAKGVVELITRYQEMSLQPECEQAIEQVVDEAIVIEEKAEPVTLNLDELTGYNKTVKDKIKAAFEKVLKLLNFNHEGHDIFKRWYVDGRIYYHVIIDKQNKEDGIQKLMFIDPRRIQLVREVKKRMDPETGLEMIDTVSEYFIYREQGINNATATVGLKVARDTICYAHSGLRDASSRNIILSYLHKAIKPLNQLRMIEDATVIYRLSRAPERRIFYVDIGTLPKNHAESYLNSLIQKYRNKLVYDANTGEVRDDKKFMSMQEDFWLPRREGGKGTEITTLPGGENLGVMEDVNYFQEKLYKALGVPVSRLKSDAGFSLGRAAEISRDEVTFYKFIQRLRDRFSMLFKQLLRTELLLTGVIDEDEWEEMNQQIVLHYLSDSHYTELKEAEILNNRLALVAAVDPNPPIGRYISMRTVWTKILRMSDDEIEAEKKQIELEKPEMDALNAQAAALQGGDDQEKEENPFGGFKSDGESR